MEAEEIVIRIKKKLYEIDVKKKEVDDMLDELMTLPSSAWDWISVSQASKQTGISISTFYNKINKGMLECKKIQSKRLVRMSDIMAIDD